MESQVYFADEKLKEVYEKLKDARTEEQEIYKWISRAIEDLKINAFTGIQVKKEQIPKEYIQKYGIDNLWKYDLPKGWRLLYSIARDGVLVLSILLEWMDHKNYERRFGY